MVTRSNLRLVCTSQRVVWRGIVSTAATLLLLMHVGVPQVIAQLPADRSVVAHLEQLEQRQLFGSIIRYCEARFGSQELPAGWRSQLAARWIRALTLRTLNLEPSAAASTWPEVRATTQRLVAETRFFPQHFLVRFQAALIGLGEARLASLLPENSATRGALREQGVAAARETLQQLRGLQQEILQFASTVPERPPATADAFPELTREQLYALARDVEYQMLAAMAVRARFYGPADLASRLDTAQQMVDLATTLQPKVSNESLLWWETQYLALEAIRALQDWRRWQTKWENSPLPLAPTEVLGKLVAARLEAQLDRQELRESVAQANDFFRLLQTRDAGSLGTIKSPGDLSDATAWPEFDVARARMVFLLAVEADRVASESSGQSVATTRLAAESQVLEFSRSVSRQHGGFWSGDLTRRLLGSVTTDRSAETVSPLLLRQLISDGEWDQVQDLTQVGIEQARSNGNAELALELATLVAGTARLLEPRPWMVERIESATLPHATHPRAAAIHHYANILAAKLPSGDEEQPPAALAVWQRHVQTWPEVETAQQIRLQIAVALDRQQQPAAAAAHLLDIPEASPSYPQAIALLESILAADLSLSGQDSVQRSARAEHWVATLRPRLESNGQWLTQWNQPAQRLALLLVQLQLETSAPQANWISSLLRLVEQRGPTLEADLRSRTTVLAALAEYHQAAAGQTALEALQTPASPISDADYRWLAQALDRRLPDLGLPGERELGSNATNAGMVRRAAQLQLVVTQAWEASYPESATSIADWLTGQKIMALNHLERTPEALELAEQVATAHPRSLQHQQWLGYTLSRSNHPTDTEAAVSQWRKIGSLTPKNSDPWFEAKYYLADAQRRLGKNEDAWKLLKYVKQTESAAWQKTPQRDQLERLLQSISP